LKFIASTMASMNEFGPDSGGRVKVFKIFNELCMSAITYNILAIKFI